MLTINTPQSSYYQVLMPNFNQQTAGISQRITSKGKESAL
jgi:hypothetical protein